MFPKALNVFLVTQVCGHMQWHFLRDVVVPIGPWYLSIEAATAVKVLRVKCTLSVAKSSYFNLQQPHFCSRWLMLDHTSNWDTESTSYEGDNLVLPVATVVANFQFHYMALEIFSFKGLDFETRTRTSHLQAGTVCVTGATFRSFAQGTMVSSWIFQSPVWIAQKGSRDPLLGKFPEFKSLRGHLRFCFRCSANLVNPVLERCLLCFVLRSAPR